MEQRIEINHINALRSAKAKYGETGDLSYELTFDVMMKPGDLERLLMVFKNRLPGTTIVINNPQAKMDLEVLVITEKQDEKIEVVESGNFIAPDTVTLKDGEAFNEDGTLKEGIMPVVEGTAEEQNYENAIADAEPEFTEKPKKKAKARA